MTEFPAYLKIVHQPDGKARATFLAELDGTLKSAESKFSEFSGEARRQLDAALSVPRNNFGSLDLGVDQLRAAAAAQEARALAAREVAQATALAAQEEGDYGQKARLTVAAVQALAREEEQAATKARIHADAVEQVQLRLDRQKSSTDLLLQSTRAGATAQQNIVNSARSSRVAFVQLGQQMQDVTVQAQMGTNAFVIFSQQVPQAAFALSGLANSANATQARIGQLATFMAGPWGAAIFAATAVVGPLVYGLLQTGDAADDAANQTYDFTSSLDVLTLTSNQATEAMKQLAGATRSAIAVQGDFLANQVAIANQSVAGLESRIAQNQAELNRMRRDAQSLGSAINPFSVPDLTGMERLRQQIQEDRKALEQARLAASSGSIAESQRAALESIDPSLRARNEYERQIGELELRRKESIRAQEDPLFYQDGRNRFEFISASEYETQFARLTQIRDAAIEANRETNRTPRKGPSDNSAREMQRLAEYGEDAAETIKRITENFDEQPRAIDRAKRATRQLDEIIAGLEERKPAGFGKMIEEAERARGIVEDALVHPFRELAEESDRRVQLQALITAGLGAEADAMQEIWRLEKSLGPLTAERKAETLDIVRAEEALTDELRDRQDLVADYLDATREVRSELEAIFSGRGFSVDGFGQIFKDLQGRVLVKEIFGDSLDQLDDLVKGRSGVETNIDFLAAETKRAGTEIGNMADVIARETARIASPSAATAPTQSAFDRAFADYVPGGASNDNWDELVVQGKVVADAVKVGALALSPADYADLLGKAIADPLLAKLDETFGAEFFGQFSGILSSAISGYVTGGEAGGIIGLFEGLNSKFGLEVLGEELAKDFSEVLGFGGRGAATGTLVNAILGGNKAGSQIGGAIGGIAGSIIPGVGNIVGSIVGSLIGSLFGGGAKYGNFSSTGGVTGNNDQARSAAGQLGSALEDAISKIADALDAEVGSYATSIGVTDGKYRISTTGRTGELKSGYSDVQVFGEGEAAAQAALQAAIADAIRDGAIQGLSPAALRLIQAADNIDAAIQDVIDFQSVFTRLQERQDPLGAALSKLDDEFEHLADVFAKAGASAEEWAQLDQLYQLERTETIKREIEALTSSLRPLYQSLTSGNSALPLRERQGLAELEYDSLASRVAAGDTSAYDDFAEAARTLLEIERELYGSQQGYFDRLSEVTALTKAALDYSEAQTQAAIANSDNPTSPNFIPANDNQGVVDAIALSNSQLAAVNANIGTTNALLRQLASATGTGPVDYF